MEYKKLQNKIVVRMDPGEEILTEMKEIALKEQIKLAEVTAIGAVNDFTVGVYNVSEKRYYANHFEGNYEVVSFLGTINKLCKSSVITKSSIETFFILSVNEVD